MAPPQDETDTGPGTGKSTFLRQLPKRIAAIEDICTKLSSGAWDYAQLEALYGRIQEISEFSKNFALFQLNESAFSLEVYLSSFIGSDVTPSPAQLDAISGLLRTLKTAASGVPATDQAAETPTGGVTVFMLGDKGGVIAALADALRSLDCDVRFFAEADELTAQLQVQPPRLIVADTATLPDLPPLTAELTRLRSHMSINIPLFFVSSSSALQLRVDAIRAGGDGYFVAPLETAEVASQICDMASPDQPAAFRVLLVEDDPTQADFAAKILRNGGIEVLQVTEPVRVIDKLREFQPDLILMDIYMPEVNGIELTTIIRDHKEFVTIPIVFLSGEQNAEKQLDALSVGGDDFVSKPIRPKHLLAIVETRIRRARQFLSATGQPPKHDRVTGLFSRQHFLDRTAKLIDDDKHPGPAGVILIRPGNLQTLQEQIGVGGLDHLLSEFGAVIGESIQDQDLAARIDEHNFGVLLKRQTPQEIVELAEHLVNRISAHEFPNHVTTTASVGLCFIDDRLEDANGIISRAKAACNEAEAQGGNRVHTHGADTESPETPASGSDDLGQRVKAALRDDAFVILYQPMLNLQTRGSETYEIVLRVPNAQGDLIGNGPLTEAAATAGVGEELDQWILDRAIDILKQRRESGRRTQIFVHQSAQTALNANMPAWLAGRLRAKQIVGTGLVLDFRLPDLSRDLKIAQQNIRSLREMDVDVSISRFPEKEAAFKVLRFLQAGYINIAPRLLKADRQVISSVIHQAHELSAKVIVSNVDDPRSIDLHWSSGADFLQGNFIQRPLENMDYDFSQVVI